MIRVAMVHEEDPDAQTARLAGALCAKLQHEFVCERVAAGAGPARMIRDVRRLRRGGFDVMHAWGGRALATALAAGGAVAFTPVKAPGRRMIGWLRAAMAQRKVEAVAHSAAMHRRLIERGIAAGRCRLIRVGVDFSTIKRRRDDGLRTALGLAEGDYALVAAGHSESWSGHEQMMTAAAIVHELDARYRLVLTGEGPAADAMRRYAGALRLPGIVVFARDRLGRLESYERLMGAADMLLATPTGEGPTLDVAAAMASALPIVATATYSVGELLEDHHTALLARPGNVRQIAQRILQLREDKDLQWRLAETSRSEAYAHFSITRFVEEHREAYRSMMPRVSLPVAG